MYDNGAFLATIVLGAKVVDRSGHHHGVLSDLAASWSGGDDLPVVTHGVIRLHGKTKVFAWANVDLSQRELRISTDVVDAASEPGPILLKQHVLDHQLVDTQDMRVVRVSDIRLANAPDGTLVVLGVDPGQYAVIRRVLPGPWADALAKRFGWDESPFIPWSDVESTGGDGTSVIRLRTTRDGLRHLHPADIADILEQLHPLERNALINSLPVETAADAVSEADEDVQREIIEQLAPEKAADILEEMEPDDAADIVQDLSGSKRKELLEEMDEEEAEELKELLNYDENTAGGLMTTSYLAVQVELTAQETIDRIRELSPDAETIYYIYVVDENHRLTGVISLRDLIVSMPNTPLWNIMVDEEKLVSVHPDDELEQVATVLEHYDLLAVPVVATNGELLGIVTVDDTLEELLPPSWRRKRGLRR
jgi:CBS domain-containing protein